MLQALLTRLRELVCGDDGKVVLTKLAAATFHLSMAASAAFITVKNKTFDPSMWSLYGGFAVGHAVVDKASAQVKDFKEQQLNAPPGA